MNAFKSFIPDCAVWEYRNYDQWKALDHEVRRTLTEAFNLGRGEISVTRDEEWTYDFNLREMSVAEYRGRTMQYTYDLRVILVLLR